MEHEMTFLTELKRLNAGATKGVWVSYWRVTDEKPDCGIFAEPREGQAYSVCRCPRYQKKKQWQDDSELIAFLHNNADAIAGLVEAAECIRHWHDSGKNGMVVSAEHVHKLWEALANMEKVK